MLRCVDENLLFTMAAFKVPLHKDTDLTNLSCLR
jgi:hypothetical protein